MTQCGRVSVCLHAYHFKCKQKHTHIQKKDSWMARSTPDIYIPRLILSPAAADEAPAVALLRRCSSDAAGELTTDQAAPPKSADRQIRARFDAMLK